MPQPPTQITKPETFIIESLSQQDNENNRSDGKILFDMLNLQNKKPIYKTFKNKDELVELSDTYRNSGYRYLHLSCHGSNEIISSTYDKIEFAQFAEIFSSKLNNRRLFISGCKLGNINLANYLYDNNGGMYSLTGPINDVHFDQASVFWSSFYYLVHSWDSQRIIKKTIFKTLNKITYLFGMPIAHFFKNAKKHGKIDVETYGVRTPKKAKRIVNALKKTS